ncbi:pilus assembly PilX N-terminal domain-containing protein [Colwellia sp. MSW7]|jgi:MSHA biogenesis protein MshP|uniref:Pilus assembly PilX N-terminal domain-containing protein n=1 Tax=Colwellia maritima TaxID=2912588 RepID=A0ABS9X196_9GAMM|nr:pilus assembly PilX N-terminal domain-containing protein [Colwellia maritima]MCI2282842.1 pilus assembly PilX N-terminal domain-containing protein [Colwellia maritima]
MINRIFQLSKVPSSVEKQSGSALMMALFILVVLILIGSALMRVLSTSSEAIAQEVIGTRAYMAANSAMQAELQKLFPLNPVDETDFQCDSNPPPYDFSTSGADVNGLYHCKAVTSCNLYATNTSTGEKFYRLTSIGKCGSSVLGSTSTDVVVSSRKIQVEARNLP